MQGILLVNKPKNWTSFDVVNFVRKIVAKSEGKKPKNTKIGHTGTLDPLATGLLILVVGKEYTRRASELSGHGKIYEVTMKLGQTSTTGDEEGEKTTVSSVQPDLMVIETALQAFTGVIMQTPPAFSAMKVNGQRAYKLAREGKAVEIEPRPVTIISNQLTDYSYPFVRFTSHVSSGTYIRSLVEDLGNRLDTGAYMSDLRRISIAEYRLGEAVEVEGLTPEIINKNLREIA